MIDQDRFQPLRGTEANILASQPIKGALYFAIDTKKIFYSDGDSFLSMGGNSSIFYGSFVPDEFQDTDKTDFEFSPDLIEGNQIPNIDDLILNLPDGCFYRVNEILLDDNFTKIFTTKLTISGSGGTGGGGGGGAAIVLKVRNNLPSSTVYCVDNESAQINFNVSSTAEDDYIQTIWYNFGVNGVIAQKQDTDGHNMGDVTFDLTPYISLLSTATSVPLNITVIDVYGIQKTLTYILNRVSIALTEDKNISSILQASNKQLQISSTPIGGGALFNKKIIYNIYNQYHDLLATLEDNVSSINNTYTFVINFEDIDTAGNGIGTYYLEMQYIGYTSVTATTPVSSNILKHSIISYDEHPLLVAYKDIDTIEQYSTLNISYMIGTSNPELITTQINLIKDSNENADTQVVEYNKIYTWSIYFDKAGLYNLILRDVFNNEIIFDNFRVTEYQGNIPVIDDSLNTLKLNLNAINRKNTEIHKDVWEDRNFTSVFENFIWDQFNGWLKDENEIDILRLSSGAKVTIDNINNGIFTTDAMNERGYTIELDFKVSGVTDFSKPLISCISKTSEDNIQTGFLITGQTGTLNTFLIKASTGVIQEGDTDAIQAYNTQIQGLTTKFLENERIHLSWVIEKKTHDRPMIKTYLNGILSGITTYINNDRMIENPLDRAKLIFDSTYGIIDIYNIRIYNDELSDTNILNNYIATLDTIQDRALKYNDNFGLLDINGNISVQSIEQGSYNLNIPYIKFTGGEKLIKNDDGKYYLEPDGESHLPYTKKDYRLINQFDFVDPTGQHESVSLTSSFPDEARTGPLNGIILYGQGTSSMEYPIKNLRVKFKMKQNGEKVTFQVNSNDYPVDILTLKADYMESSSSHNTGTANIIYNLLETLRYKTPGQQYYNLKNPDYKTLTAIRGYPIICFYRSKETDTYEYIGRYNLNMDKSSENVFGFQPDPLNQPESLDNTFGWANVQDTITDKTEGIVNTIHCYEFKNNASDLCNFLCSKYRKAKLSETDEELNEIFNPNEQYYIQENNNFIPVNTPHEEDFDIYYIEQNVEKLFYQNARDEKGNLVPNWFNSFESRYPEAENDDGSDVDLKSWYTLWEWVNSTDTSAATGLDGDTEENRLSKFKNEFTNHFNLEFTTFYYILTHVLLMIDSRAKNMMMATWDNQIWYPIFYDMDTMLGLNNNGYNKFDYNIEDRDLNIYNGQNSVLWKNFRKCFATDIQQMYDRLQAAGLTYESLLIQYNNKQADAWNEMLYNQDANYKYIQPYTNGFWNGITGKAEWVEAGKKNYLYAAQGSRSMHRRYWLKNRLNYLNGKYLSTIYKDDKFAMRIYTPQVGAEDYYRVNSKLINAENFGDDQYYIRVLDNENNYIFQIAEEYIPDIEYYKKSAQNLLDVSIQSIPPNNDFILTPLYNQYLSVAFGGDNGVTAGPLYAQANTSKVLEAPTGSLFHDTETYIYGGSSLKDLGDLSSQYLGLFTFPNNSTKLERLTLGNLNNNYYNPYFGDLTIGPSAPYLKELNVANCQGLQAGLDLHECQNLQKLFATGSRITTVSFAQHGLLEEVRLPISINSLTLIDEPFLSTEKFTIGTYDSDTQTYSANNFNNLIYIYIDNVPLLDTYNIALNAEHLQDFAFLNINWTIHNNNTEINLENNSITVLDKLNVPTKRPLINSTLASSVTGIINLSEITNSTIALQLYEKYIAIYPNLQFVFNNDTIKYVNIYDSYDNLDFSKPISKNDEITAEFLDGYEPRPPISNSQWKYSWTGNWIIGTELQASLIGTIVHDNLNIKPEITQELQKYEITFKNGETIIHQQSYDYGTLINDIIANNIITLPYKDDNELGIFETYHFQGYSTHSDDTDALIFTENSRVIGKMTYYAVFKLIDVGSHENVNEDYFEVCTSNNNYLFNYRDPKNSTFDVNNGLIITVKPNLDQNALLYGKITVPAKMHINNTAYPVIGVKHLIKNTTQTNITGIFFEENNQIRTITNAIYVSRNSELKYFEIPENVRILGNAKQFYAEDNNPGGGGSEDDRVAYLHTTSPARKFFLVYRNSTDLNNKIQSFGSINTIYLGTFDNLGAYSSEQPDAAAPITKIQIPNSVSLLGKYHSSDLPDNYSAILAHLLTIKSSKPPIINIGYSGMPSQLPFETFFTSQDNLFMLYVNSQGYPIKDIHIYYPKQSAITPEDYPTLAKIRQFCVLRGFASSSEPRIESNCTVHIHITEGEIINND